MRCDWEQGRQDTLTDTWEFPDRTWLLACRTADLDLRTPNIELRSRTVRTARSVDCDVLRAKQVLSILDVFGDLEIELRPAIAQPGHGEAIVRVRLYAHLVDLEPVAFTLVS